MKQTLESVLLGVEPRPILLDPTLDGLVYDRFFVGGQYRLMSKAMDAIQNGAKLSLQKAFGSWDSMPLLIGTMYRMQVDGYQVFEKLGMTPEEVAQTSRTFQLIREKVQAMGAGGVKSTPTKELHDHIVSNYF